MPKEVTISLVAADQLLQVAARSGNESRMPRAYELRVRPTETQEIEMFAWIRRRFLAPHPLPLNETLARLERLSWDDRQQRVAKRFLPAV
jgi:hypothetical protein